MARRSTSPSRATRYGVLHHTSTISPDADVNHQYIETTTACYFNLSMWSCRCRLKNCDEWHICGYREYIRGMFRYACVTGNCSKLQNHLNCWGLPINYILSCLIPWYVYEERTRSTLRCTTEATMVVPVVLVT